MLRQLSAAGFSRSGVSSIDTNSPRLTNMIVCVDTIVCLMASDLTTGFAGSRAV